MVFILRFEFLRNSYFTDLLAGEVEFLKEGTEIHRDISHQIIELFLFYQSQWQLLLNFFRRWPLHE